MGTKKRKYCRYLVKIVGIDHGTLANHTTLTAARKSYNAYKNDKLFVAKYGNVRLVRQTIIEEDIK